MASASSPPGGAGDGAAVPSSEKGSGRGAALASTAPAFAMTFLDGVTQRFTPLVHGASPLRRAHGSFFIGIVLRTALLEWDRRLLTRGGSGSGHVRADVNAVKLAVIRHFEALALANPSRVSPALVDEARKIHVMTIASIKYGYTLAGNRRDVIESGALPALNASTSEIAMVDPSEWRTRGRADDDDLAAQVSVYLFRLII